MLLILLGAVALVAIFVLLRLKENNMDVASIPSTPKPVGKYSKETPEVIIVGAGIAGNGLAKAFADQGRQVLLLERDLSEPDRIVGELLQPGGMQALKKLGMESTFLTNRFSISRRFSKWSPAPRQLTFQIFVPLNTILQEHFYHITLLVTVPAFFGPGFFQR
jgi:hypothetical protein